MIEVGSVVAVVDSRREIIYYGVCIGITDDKYTLRYCPAFEPEYHSLIDYSELKHLLSSWVEL